ncbi:MAG: hypothetical protein OEY49_01170 [Candidatus Heimdallarchaeota archaeon]|nr:hypothetical protein [Candidatus Heimdallarchaeota archaeon]
MEVKNINWKDWQERIDNCEIIIWYGSLENLYPISQWIHLGAFPIGYGTLDDIRQDLPNLDWIIRHLAWLGFNKFRIISISDYNGLELFYQNYFENLDITFAYSNLYEFIYQRNSNTNGQLIIIPGHLQTNADLRHALLLHRQRGNEISLLAIRGLQFRVGLAEVKVENNLNIVSKFQEKPLNKSELISSEIIIINDKLFNSTLLKELNYTQTPGKDISEEAFLNEILDLIIQKKELSEIELTGITGEPWFIDLSDLETWVKLDHDNFIRKFSHLIKE